MVRPRCSEVWQLMAEDPKTGNVQCQNCSRQFARNPTDGSTKSMWDHVKQKHPTLYAKTERAKANRKSAGEQLKDDVINKKIIGKSIKKENDHFPATSKSGKPNNKASQNTVEDAKSVSRSLEGPIVSMPTQGRQSERRKAQLSTVVMSSNCNRRYAIVFFPETEQYAIVEDKQIQGECRKDAVVFITYEDRPYIADVVAVDTNRNRLNKLVNDLVKKLNGDDPPKLDNVSTPVNAEKTVAIRPDSGSPSPIVKIPTTVPDGGERVLAEFVTTTVELIEKNGSRRQIPLRQSNSNGTIGAVRKQLNFGEPGTETDSEDDDEIGNNRRSAKRPKLLADPTANFPMSTTKSVTEQLFGMIMQLRWDLDKCKTEIQMLKNQMPEPT